MALSDRALLVSLEREVRRCRPIALRHFGTPHLRVSRKPDRSPVTDADRAVEERLRMALRRLAPGETILGEEFGRSGHDADSYWTIDPIDGTRAYSRGLPSWGIMVGRVERRRATLGLVDFPVLSVTMGAARGVPSHERKAGSRRRFPPPRPVRGLGDAVIFHGGARWWAGTRWQRGFGRLVQACFLERAYGDCYGYLWAFRGCADAVIDYGVKPWDLVPLAALAQGSGRVLTDCSGRPGFSGPDTVMGHPAFIRQICAIFKRQK
jgi:histidinol-phosphatase